MNKVKERYIAVPPEWVHNKMSGFSVHYMTVDATKLVNRPGRLGKEARFEFTCKGWRIVDRHQCAIGALVCACGTILIVQTILLCTVLARPLWDWIREIVAVFFG